MAESQEKQEADLKCKLIVNYLPPTVSDRELYSLFSTVGRVEHCRVAKDIATNKSLCYAFVTFYKPEDAKRAIDSLNGLPICNKRIRVSYAGPPTKNSKLTNLYISHLPVDISIDAFVEMFEKFGKIVHKHLMRDKVTGVMRGAGFVRYDTPQEAQKAIEAMNGKVLKEGDKALVVKLADHPYKKAAAPAGSVESFAVVQRATLGPTPVIDQNLSIGADGRVTQFININQPGSFSVIWGDRQFRYNPMRNERVYNPLERYNPIGNGGGYY